MNSSFKEIKKDQPVLTQIEAADILGVSVSSISHAESSNKIKEFNHSGKTKNYPLSEVIKYGFIYQKKSAKELFKMIHEKYDLSKDNFAKLLIHGLNLEWLYNIEN